MISRILFFFIGMLSCTRITAQTAPEIGKPCPDFFLSDVQHYAKKETSLNDFKGKLLVIDFWSKGCVSCVQSFPKVNELQQEFKDDVQFLLVAINDKVYNKDIDKMFEKFRSKMNLDLAVAYDSTLWKKFGVPSVPHIIIVDREGIVRAITSSSDLKRETLKELVLRNNSLFGGKEAFYSLDLPYLFIKPGKVDSIENGMYCSVIVPASEKLKAFDILEYEKGVIQMGGRTLRQLYSWAYFNGVYVSNLIDVKRGFIWPWPVIEVKDSSSFYTADEEKRYNYSLTIPVEKDVKQRIFTIFKEDLERYFGYDVKLETRMMPYWKLTATDQARRKLRTSGKSTGSVGDFAGRSFTNVPVQDILQSIAHLNKTDAPYLDETGIVGNIDLTLDVIMTDLNEVKKALRKNGLDLVRAQREMTCIVIRDPKPGNCRK